VGKEVPRVEGGRRVVVPHHEVGRVARGKFPQRDPERAFGEGVVVVDEGEKGGIPKRRRIARDVVREQPRREELPHDVTSEPVRSDPDPDPAGEHRPHLGRPHRVVHVRARVVDHARRPLGEEGELGPREVDPVDEERPLGEDPEPIQPLCGANTVLVEGVQRVLLPLGEVDVERKLEGSSRLPRAGEGLIGEGERGVEPHVGSEVPPLPLLTGEPDVLRDPLLALPLPAAVRDLVAEVGPQPDLGDGPFELGERPRDRGRRRMVVEQGRHPAPEMAHCPHERRLVDRVQVEGPVELPPQLVQDLPERMGGEVREGHPPSEGRVEVSVSVDETGGDEAPPRIDPLSPRDLRRWARACRRDPISLDEEVPGGVARPPQVGNPRPFDDQGHATSVPAPLAGTNGLTPPGTGGSWNRIPRPQVPDP